MTEEGQTDEEREGKEELLDVLIKKVRKRCKGQMCKESTDRIE